MIFYGPEGAGKKTRVIAFIQEVYGVSLTLMEEMRSFKLENPNKTIEYSLISSNVHIEITPADNEFDDRHIIQKVVKDIASSKEVNLKSMKKFKIVVINEADRLSKEAQGSLRRTMEKYMESCRMILICKNVHKLIAPIRSRCINIRIPAPSVEEIKGILTWIARDQVFEVGPEVLQRMAKASGRNLRDAISQL
jgi:replication factor C subunit 3/5